MYKYRNKKKLAMSTLLLVLITSVLQPFITIPHSQRACLQMVFNTKPRQRFMPNDKTGFQYKIWRIVDSKPFEVIIFLLIALNAIVLMLKV